MLTDMAKSKDYQLYSTLVDVIQNRGLQVKHCLLTQGGWIVNICFRSRRSGRIRFYRFRYDDCESVFNIEKRNFLRYKPVKQIKICEEDNVKEQVKNMSIKLADINNLISSLSGGNQQKVIIGKSLLTSPKVLLMDEPTRGIDVSAKTDIFKIMDKLAVSGQGIIFVASELKEILAISDRILVFSKGKITGEYNREEATEEALVSASAVGHEIVRTT